MIYRLRFRLRYRTRPTAGYGERDWVFTMFIPRDEPDLPRVGDSVPGVVRGREVWAVVETVLRKPTPDVVTCPLECGEVMEEWVEAVRREASAAGYDTAADGRPVHRCEGRP